MVEMVQRRAARCVLNRFDRNDGETDQSMLMGGGLNRGFTVSMLYKIRYLLISHDGAKVQSSGHSYSTRSMVEYSYTQPTYKYSFYP